MLRYHLSDSDLSEVRFAISPLNELGLSLRALSDPARFPTHLRWVRQVVEDLPSDDLEVLRALVDERLWVPDFLNPVPTTPLTRFDDELDAVAALPGSRVDRDLDAVHRVRPAPLRGPSETVRDRVLDAVATYWDVSFRTTWARMRGVLDADIVHRGRTVGRSGLAGMFADLAPAVSFDGRTVSVALRDPRDRTIHTGGAGLTLIPSLFTLRVSSPVTDDGPPSVIYPARGSATLWEPVRPRGSGALRNLLGATRAGLLLELRRPGSSTELAARHGVSTSAVNQHLRAMHDAGLLTRARHGRSTLYLTSELGESLAAVADDPTRG
jgi:DNA-binding transcriptional ArsR family regulator